VAEAVCRSGKLSGNRRPDLRVSDHGISRPRGRARGGLGGDRPEPWRRARVWQRSGASTCRLLR
jgi:hypothetical protein